MKRLLVAVMLVVLGISMAASFANAEVTPDNALHPEINKHLWEWMNTYFDQILANTQGNKSLSELYQKDKRGFISDLLSAMEKEGFVFHEDDRVKIMRMNHKSPKFPIMAMCYTQIGSYIEWTIEDHYLFSQLMLKAGIYSPYGFNDTLPSDGILPSRMYQDARTHALESFPEMAAQLDSLDVLIEYQQYSHPDFNSYELWSVLWYDEEMDYKLCAKLYTTENDLWPVGVWHIFDFE